MKLALSMLCENPLRKTGLTTLFHEFVSHGLKLFPDVSWLLFVGIRQEWSVFDPQVEIVRDFPANDQLNQRLLADHFKVPAVARARGADVLLTVGFVPARKLLPTAMHVLSLQHMDRHNRIGVARQLYRRWVMKYSWPKADLILTNSKFAQSQILALCPNFHDRIVQSYEGLQHEQFNPSPLPNEAARLEARIGLGPGYFLWISNFYPYKQAELLLEGYARLDPQIRQRHPMVMVGGDWENALEEARVRAQALGLAGQVKFLGWIEDEWLAPLYRHALAFCLASREETFGRCVIESMACGTPCIVNNIPVMHEVTDGRALIVDFKDAMRVAEALSRLAGENSTRARLRQEGLEHARQFTFERLATERITAIQRLVARKTVGSAG